MPRSVLIRFRLPAHGPLISPGVWLFLVAILLIAVADCLIKLLSERYSVGQIIFFQATAELLPIAFLVWRSGGLASLRTSRPLAHAARGLICLCELAAFTYAYSVMPVADAYAISFAAPLIVVALAVPLLGERFDAIRAGAVAVGFVGVLVILQPGGSGAGGFVSLGGLAALVATFAYALMMITARGLGQVESASAMGFYPTAFVALASLGLLSLEFVRPTPVDFMLLCMVGLIGGTVTILINQAFRLTPSAVLAPLDYTAMLWALLFGYAIWGDLPSGQLMVGAAILVASGLFLIGRDAAGQAAVQTDRAHQKLA